MQGSAADGPLPMGNLDWGARKSRVRRRSTDRLVGVYQSHALSRHLLQRVQDHAKIVEVYANEPYLDGAAGENDVHLRLLGSEDGIMHLGFRRFVRVSPFGAAVRAKSEMILR